MRTSHHKRHHAHAHLACFVWPLLPARHILRGRSQSAPPARKNSAIPSSCLATPPWLSYHTSHTSQLPPHTAAAAAAPTPLHFFVFQVLATVSVGLTLVVMTSVSGGLVDQAGRRSLMLIGTMVMAVALAALSGTLFWLNDSPRAQGYLVRGGEGQSSRNTRIVRSPSESNLHPDR